MRISTKLGLSTIVISLFTSILLFVSSYSQLKQKLVKHEFEWEKTVAEEMMKQIDRSMYHAQRDLKLLAEDEIIQAYLRNRHLDTPETFEVVKSQLAERLKFTGPWLSLALIDTEGRKLIHLDHHNGSAHQSIHNNHVAIHHQERDYILHSNHHQHSLIHHYPKSQLAFKAALTGKFYNSDYVYSDYADQPTIIFSAPVKCQKGCVNHESGAAITGVIVAHYDWSAIELHLQTNNPGLVAHLFSQQGKAIANSPGFAAQQHLEEDITEIQTLLNSEETHHIHHSSVDNEQELAILIEQAENPNFNSYHWKLLLEESLDSVLSEVNDIRLQASLLAVASLFFLAFLLGVIAQVFISPLKPLTELTNRIGRGDYSTRVPVKTNDEIGQLSSNFNKMVDRLAERNEALQASKAHLKKVIDTVPGIFYTIEMPSNTFTYISPAGAELLGYPSDFGLGDALALYERIIHPDDMVLVQQYIENATQNEEGYIAEYRLRHYDGHYIWFEDRFDWERDEQGNIIAAQGILTEIGERRALYENLKKTSRQLRAIHNADQLLLKSDSLNEYLQGMCHNLVHEDDYSFVWIGLLDYENLQQINLVISSGDNPKLLTKLQKDPISNCGTECAACVALRQQKIITINDIHAIESESKACIVQPSEHNYQSLTCLPITYHEQALGVLCLYDERKNVFTEDETEVLSGVANSIAYGVQNLKLKQQHEQAQAQIHFHAFHDALTGLANRNLLLSTLEQTIKSWNRSNESIAVLLIDLDEFKLVNDTLGHQIGDALLQEVASRIQSVVRQTDIIARQGGDEFIILMNGLAPQESQIRKKEQQDELLTPANLAQRIIDILAVPFDINGHISYIGCSIGISVCPFDSENELELLQFADAAMYRAKEIGGSCYQFYSQELTDKQQNRLSIATGLHHAIQNQEFVLHYQPVVELTSGRIVGVEALIRWQKPDGELLPPSYFLGVAEDTGLIEQIGDWVVQQVRSQAEEWQQNNIDLHIAFNLSPRQFWQQDVVNKVLNAIAESGLPPHALMVEITETAMSLDEQRVTKTMQEFDQGGLYVYLDDFGTGYSSMSRLKSLPIHTLKMDQSFIAGLPNSENDLAIVNATLNLANSLGIETLAEGIETLEQYRWLVNNGCLYGQGFYFSKPVPIEELMQLVNNPPNWQQRL